MMSLSDVFRERYCIPGWIYIQGSLSAQVLKFGITKNLSQRTRRNRTQKYGGIGDWKLLYRVWIDSSGRVEAEVLARLKQYKVIRIYLKDGRDPQSAREIVNCDFATALEALESCLSEDERASAWRSHNAEAYEFSRRFDDDLRNSLERAMPRAPVGLPVRLFFCLNVDQLNLSVRSENCLRKVGIFYIGTLVQKSEAELLKIPSLNRKSLYDIIDALAYLGLSLCLQIPDWPPQNLEELSKRVSPFLKGVDSLELSVRSTLCLHNADILYIGELVQYSESEIRRMPGFHRKSINEIEDSLARLDLHFGMQLSASSNFDVC